MGARLRTAGREEKDGNTWWVLVAGEKTDEDLGTWRRAAPAPAAHQSSESEGARHQSFGEREVRVSEL